MIFAASRSSVPHPILFLLYVGKVMNHYKGFAGAVKSVQCSPEGTSGEELVAACGLDRYLRVYSVNPPKLKHQVCKILLTLLILNFVHVNDC